MISGHLLLLCCVSKLCLGHMVQSIHHSYKLPYFCYGAFYRDHLVRIHRSYTFHCVSV